MENKTFIYANSHFILRSDTLENWNKNNPVLFKNEIVHVEDGIYPEIFKRGDGVTHWNDLPWWPEAEVDQWETVNDRSQKALNDVKGLKARADNGEFNGEKGAPGPQGPQGDDYILTESDKTEIASLVLAEFTDVAEVGQ